MSNCHCGSGKAWDSCCGPVIGGERPAETAEALMRSRYSAYVVGAVDYLGETLHPDHRSDWDRNATARWAAEAEWQGLEVVATEAGGPEDEEGVVEFIAHFNEQGRPMVHRERSRFRRVDGRWYYVDGDIPKPRTQRREGPRVGRNDPCPCGSGRKFKKCCGR
ncbi:MAG: YchJ family protein [Gammaproteobacteria bacterium]|nr:MAG: YchJ family protein [Gammaproteobacteria bacterium]